MQLRCEVTQTEQDNGLPTVPVEAKSFTERPCRGGFTYVDRVELNFEITLAQMAEDGDEAEHAWWALQTSRQTCQQRTNLLIAWRTRLAEAPHVERQAKAHLTDLLSEQAKSTSATKQWGTAGAVWLAVRSLPLFPVFVGERRLATTGIVAGAFYWAFYWPIWSHPATLDTARFLVQLDYGSFSTDQRQALGVRQLWRSRMVPLGDRQVLEAGEVVR